MQVVMEEFKSAALENYDFGNRSLSHFRPIENPIWGKKPKIFQFNSYLEVHISVEFSMEQLQTEVFEKDEIGNRDSFLLKID